MNNEINESLNNEPQCCIDFCETSFEGSEKQIVNSYKCRQKRFSISDFWRITKNKREFVRKSGL